MKNLIKNLLKKYFLILKIRNRLYPSTQISQRHLFHYYQDCKKKNIPKLAETGFRVFSQFEEDGKLLFIFSVIGMDNKTFIEIGSDDGVNSNCANLHFNFGWHGLFIDGNKNAIERGQKFYSKYPHPWNYSPKFVCVKVLKDNINQVIENAGFSGEVGLLSIDIDGNDYWIWDALEIISPQVVIIETHNEFGYEDIVVPYDPDYLFPGKHPVYHGASPIAMRNLARQKGYRLVGANEMGFNFIFIKNGLAETEIPEVSVESLLQHPSTIESFDKFKEISEWEYVRNRFNN
ncbi:hypothetical protein [Sunxiuqinia rutila]|uniref:hypothetical protein n=1 Tax=Sunxiuqinia rutila TaxID=1397841 RepID=UPI003D359E86